jgi:hypothetical protein
MTGAVVGRHGRVQKGRRLKAEGAACRRPLGHALRAGRRRGPCWGMARSVVTRAGRGTGDVTSHERDRRVYGNHRVLRVASLLHPPHTSYACSTRPARLRCLHSRPACWSRRVYHETGAVQNRKCCAVHQPLLGKLRPESSSSPSLSTLPTLTMRCVYDLPAVPIVHVVLVF